MSRNSVARSPGGKPAPGDSTTRQGYHYSFGGVAGAAKARASRRGWKRKGGCKIRAERVIEAIESTGLVEPMGAGWKHLICKAPRMSHDEPQRIMAGKPSLSELIIAERNEGLQ